MSKRRTRRNRGQKRPTRSFESLELRRVLAADFVISEFLASNDNGIRDEDHNRPDWIELMNAGDQSGSLDGWFLTDDADDLDKWELPDVELSPSERVVVFASGKDRAPTDGELHSNFRLNIDGGYLALVHPDGLTTKAVNYPEQSRDVSFGFPQSTTDAALIEPNDAARLFIPTSENGGDSLGEAWTTAEFNDADWLETTNAIGYERRSNYEDIFTTDLGDQMFEVSPSVYMRMPFEIADASSVFSLSLSMKYDDGYVAYINGQEVARRNAPTPLTWNAQATDAHADRFAVNFEEVVIDPFQFDNLLLTGKNALAIHTLNDDIASSDFLIVPKLEARTAGGLHSTVRQYFPHPSPALPNGTGTTVFIGSVVQTPRSPTSETPITVSASIESTFGTVLGATLHYRVMYGDETSIEMSDDGLHQDGAANDGIFGVTIPAGVASPGQMLRYYVTATATPLAGVGNEEARLPEFADPIEREEYLGTVIHDSSITSNLKVIHWFLEDAEAKNSIDGTRGSLFHDGNFYDNIRIDTTGRTVGLSGPKKSHDIFFPSDHWFELTVGDKVLRMNDFDLISDYWNRAKVRVPLGYQTLNDVGTPAHLSMPVRVQENGTFYGTYSFVDGGNERFLDRAGLDPGGALYKMNLGFSTARGVYKKQTRNFEDATDLGEFFDGLALEGEQQSKFLWDNLDIPATVNYLAGLVIMGHGDCCDKNLYIYRDTEVTGEWQPLPWDVDSAFGRGGVGLAQSVFPSAAPLFTGSDNPLFETLFGIPEFREMYLRRLRSLMDEFIQAGDTPLEDRHFERRIDEMAADLAPDVALDFEKWGSWIADSATGAITHSHEGVPTWQEELELLKTEYLPARRMFLYNSLRNANRGEELSPQTDAPQIVFGEIDFSPASGNQDEEYLVLQNPNEFAVDITDWQIIGGVTHRFAAGTVIPANGTLYVSPNVAAFRARTTGPSGGQGLFVTGNYSGHISNYGETLRLATNKGVVIDTANTSRSLTPEQQYLRISELMYNPASEPGRSRFENDDFEFVELMNISTTETIQLEHASLASGVEFALPKYALAPGERVVVVADSAAFVHRYGSNIPILGEYGRTEEGYRLSNGGESISLQLATGDVVQEFVYDDAWHPSTDAGGNSLTIIDAAGSLNNWNESTGWTASQQVNGSPGLPDSGSGDLNGDGRLDVSDIDVFCAGFRSGSMQFDALRDGVLNEADIVFFVRNVLGGTIGDVNSDGLFNSSDFVAIFQTAEFEDDLSGNSTWTDGDWNCDGDFTTADFVFAFQHGKFVAAAHNNLTLNLAAAAIHDRDNR